MTEQERIAKIPVLALKKVQLKKEYENIQKEREDFMKEWNIKFQENRHRFNLISREIDDIIVEQWIERGKQGMNKNVYYSEIPPAVNAVCNKLRDKIMGGCTGDWNDGCRGCNVNCSAKAQHEWQKMFGIENIQYGNRNKSK